MFHSNRRFFLAFFILIKLLAPTSAIADVMDKVRQVQRDWAIATYQLKDDKQEQAFKTLVEDVTTMVKKYPTSAEAWTWSGIVKSSYAGARGGLGALSLAKQSRRDLEQAMTLNPEVLEGSAYTSLATLYAQVPGWPLGFGNKEKARELFARALAINPQGIDPNYFYAEFLLDQGHYLEAEKYYLIARAAPARPERPLADTGRQGEIDTGLAQVRQELKQDGN